MLKSLFSKKNKAAEEEFENSLGEFDQYLLTSLSPDYIEEHQGYVQLGSNFTRTLLVMDWSTVLSQEDVQNLSEISNNVSITYHFDPVNLGEIRNNLSKAVKSAKRRITDERLDDASRIDAEVQRDDATMVLRQLATGSTNMFQGHMLVHINAPSLKDLDNLTQQVKSMLGSIGTAHTPSIRAYDAYESFLPLGKNKVGELTSRLMDSEAVSYLFPFHENEMFEEEGVFVGINEKTKNVILVNDKKLLNKHKVYIGISGVGKSTAIWNDIIKKWQLGEKVICNDPKGEFGAKFRNLGGEWIYFSLKESGSRLNPFDLPKVNYEGKVESDDYVESGNPIFDKIPSLLVMFNLMYPDMSDLQENIVSGIIVKTYEKKFESLGIDINDLEYSSLSNSDYPTLSDFDNMLQSVRENDAAMYKHLQDFHLAIDIYINGIYSNVFNGKTNVDVSNNLVAYDSKEFQENEKVQRILYYNIMSHITYSALNGNGEETTVVFDEAHVIADPKTPKAMQQLYFMLKVLRSFNVGVYTATQSIKDFLSAKDDKRNYGEAVINQSIQRMYLPMQEFEIAFLEKELAHKFSEKEKSILTVRDAEKSKQAGKGILFLGTKKVQCTVRLNKVEAQLWFEGKKLEDIRVS
ncbi:VirB4 family type IV secretion system protein [Terribacillus saccharophilus]|uniref:VirB4 family type IV secretion system protein n=1 Tax=Terribacillus saccharophilus TaxID=361277 RepID=UPI002989B153|nr:TrsE [Terribacillus saccharophilus]MCM3227560.1 TrsE [Terribacillus saccharophilus]